MKNFDINCQHLINDIKNIVSAAQNKAICSVNFERTLMYWNR